jgi:hypothetical protein
MTWWDIDDGNGEIGVLEVGDELELVLLVGGSWVWRDAEGRVLRLTLPGTA